MINGKTTLRDCSISDISTFLNKCIFICGWIKSIRAHGKLNFIDLVDRDSIIQIVCKFETSSLKPGYVLQVRGTVQERTAKTKNTTIDNGEIEIVCIDSTNINILAESHVLPFDCDDTNLHDETYFNFPYLKLRSDRKKQDLKLKSDFMQACREFLNHKNFLEIITPILTKSSREGSKPFIVPLDEQEHFALAQSPQVYKQALMVGRIDRYYQIAVSCRNENTRSSRQPEFEQLDLEMSFVNEEDIRDILENLLKFVLERVFNFRVNIPFPLISYDQAMSDFGTDEPEIVFLSKHSEDASLVHYCIANICKTKLNPYMYDEQDGQIFLKNIYIKDFQEKCLSFINNKYSQFIWVNKFPLFKKENGILDTVRHIFTKIIKLETNPLDIRTYGFDLIFNGREILSGSLRNSDPKVQVALINILDTAHRNNELLHELNYFIKMLEYGAPPHGGVGLGISRLLYKILDRESICDFIAFPKNSKGICSLTGAPKVEK